MKNKIEVLRRLYRNRWAGKKKYNPRTLTRDQKTILEKLKKDGIIIIPNFMSVEQCNSIIEQIDKKFNNVDFASMETDFRKPENRFGVLMEDGSRCWADSLHSDLRCFGAEHISNDLMQFLNDENFVTIGSAMLERNISPRWCMANHTQYLSGNQGSGGGWHRDDTYRNGFKALVYLVDVTTENGCFQYIPKSSSVAHHLLKTPIPDKHQYTDEEVYKMVGGKITNIFDVVGKAGTLVLFDTNGVHRGKPIQKGFRYAITNYYLDK